MKKNTANDEYFVRMMLPVIKKKAKHYESEEKHFLLKLLSCLSNKEQYQLAVIGAGALSYVDLAIRKQIEYVAIEPLINLYIQKELLFLVKQQANVSVIPKCFGDFSPAELKRKNRIFLFTFNVFAYIDDPIERINRYIKRGDILFISTWNLHSKQALDIRKGYFDFIRESMLATNLSLSDFLSGKIYNLDCFDLAKLKFYTSNERFTNNITDILIVKL